MTEYWDSTAAAHIDWVAAIRCTLWPIFLYLSIALLRRRP